MGDIHSWRVIRLVVMAPSLSSLHSYWAVSSWRFQTWGRVGVANIAKIKVFVKHSRLPRASDADNQNESSSIRREA